MAATISLEAAGICYAFGIDRLYSRLCSFPHTAGQFFCSTALTDGISRHADYLILSLATPSSARTPARHIATQSFILLDKLCRLANQVFCPNHATPSFVAATVLHWLDIVATRPELFLLNPPVRRHLPSVRLLFVQLFEEYRLQYLDGPSAPFGNLRPRCLDLRAVALQLLADAFHEIRPSGFMVQSSQYRSPYIARITEDVVDIPLVQTQRNSVPSEYDYNDPTDDLDIIFEDDSPPSSQDPEDDIDCPICYHDLDENRTVSCRTCRKYMHEECITKWAEAVWETGETAYFTCPCCRGAWEYRTEVLQTTGEEVFDGVADWENGDEDRYVRNLGFEDSQDWDEEEY